MIVSGIASRATSDAELRNPFSLILNDGDIVAATLPERCTELSRDFSGVIFRNH
jgi:hypothetical protein